MSNTAIQLSIQYIQAGDLDRAEETLQQLLRETPDDIQGLCLLGSIHQARGNLEEALGLFKEAASRDPQSAAPCNHMGSVFIQARQPNEAIVCLEEALRLDPFSSEAYNNLGKAHLLHKRETDALACFREAVHLYPDYVEALNNLSLMHIARREFDEARLLLERLVQIAPAYPGALVGLSVIHFEKGELDQALTVAQQALQLDPRLAAVQDQVGVVLLKMGRYEEAVEHFRQALQIAPQYNQANEHLGLALVALRRLDEAAVCLRRAVQLDPANGRALSNLVAVLMELRRWADVAELASQAVQRQPNSPEMFHNLGLAYFNLRDPGRAIAALEQALKLRPDYPEALCDLGMAFINIRQFPRSMEVLHQALRLKPNFPSALNNLALVYDHLHQHDEACATYEEAVRLRPNFPKALGGLANVYKTLGRLEEAIACYRRCIALDPRQAVMYSNLLYCLHYLPGLTPESIFSEYLTWARHHAVPPSFLRPHSNVLDADRRLRIGYVSADFREHVMGCYAERVLQARTRERFEVTCYSNGGKGDDTTRRIRELADQWRDIRDLSDDKVEELIRQDRIDLLVDLSGHMGGNRMSLFARKPAPVQVTHYGYQFTSGNPAINYRITDAVCDPPGMTERYHTEQLVRLPEIHWCYRPNLDMEVNDLPASSAGYVTFGVLNAFSKLTTTAIALWAQILARLPDSRLLILAGVSPRADQRLRDAFSEHGIDPGRLTLMSKRSRPEYFRLYQGVDLCLDSFPYTGCNTTCDSLWMGVPVVTLAGQTAIARQGASPLAHLGLHDLITGSAEEYVETALRLAADRPRLVELRATLRERMSRSTLMNIERFTQQLEEAYRWMWRQWCFQRRARSR
ncbi:MAG TPA: tetratricopeptide repeat protein [Gemmataceae bacterium]|nr:tetratricopeptide repeat protein [Gemmataceae bacterium]